MNETNKELITLSNDTISLLEILLEYCKNNQDCEDMIRIYPLIKVLNENANKLWIKISNLKPENIA